MSENINTEIGWKRLTADNLDKEHICCAITEKKGETGAARKKAWIRERLEDGLTFLKLDVRGKVFIEYLPAEAAWCPIEAEGYLYIDCFWVSGQYKGKGYADRLLEQCIEDAKEQGKKGIVCLSARTKKPYLSDPKYLKYKGFQAADTAEPYFELLYLPFQEGAEIPRFKDCAKNGRIQETDQVKTEGFDLYYTEQCPFAAQYAPLLEQIVKEKGLDCRIHKLESREEAKNAPCPFTTYALFYKGGFLTHEIMNEKSFQKLWESLLHIS